MQEYSIPPPWREREQSKAFSDTLNGDNHVSPFVRQSYYHVTLHQFLFHSPFLLLFRVKIRWELRGDQTSTG